MAETIPPPYTREARAALSGVFKSPDAEYGIKDQIVLQVAILDTLLSIEEKLTALAGSQNGSLAGRSGPLDD